MAGKETVLYGHASGVGEPSSKSDSGFVRPLIPTWLGEAGTLLKPATSTPALTLQSLTEECSSTEV